MLQPILPKFYPKIFMLKQGSDTIVGFYWCPKIKLSHEIEWIHLKSMAETYLQRLVWMWRSTKTFPPRNFEFGQGLYVEVDDKAPSFMDIQALRSVPYHLVWSLIVLAKDERKSNPPSPLWEFRPSLRGRENFLCFSFCFLKTKIMKNQLQKFGICFLRKIQNFGCKFSLNAHNHLHHE